MMTNVNLYASLTPVNNPCNVSLSDFEGFNYNMDFGMPFSLGAMDNDGKMEFVLSRSFLNVIKDMRIETSFPFKMTRGEQTIWFCSRVIEFLPRGLDSLAVKTEVTSEVLISEREPRNVKLEDCG